MKKITILLLLAAIHFTACSDDSGAKNECDYRCVGNISYSCDADGNPVQRDCGKLGCNEKTQTCNFTTVADECAAKAKECTEDGYIKTCSEGHWVTSDAACPNGCQDGACLPESGCTEEALQCHDKQLEICKNNQWVLKEECTKGCQDNACLPDLICTESSLQCGENKLEKCSGNQWILDHECPFGCKDNACLACAEDSLQCGENKLEICTSGQWTFKEECPYGCEDNKCKPNPCDDFKMHCEGDKLFYCEGGKIQSYDCKHDKGVCKDTSSGVKCVISDAQCTEAKEMVGEYQCNNMYFVYQACEKIDDAFYLVEHWAESLCHETDGGTELLICTDYPKNDGVYLPYKFEDCSSSCKATPETADDYEYAVCDDVHYGGAYDVACPATLVMNCDAANKMCISNNILFDCLIPCHAGDPDIIQCDLNNEGKNVAQKVTCREFQKGSFGYYVLDSEECKGKCTTNKGCE